MKVRDSEMPAESSWEEFFQPSLVLEKFGIGGGDALTVADFGCGYGTFALEAARRVRGLVWAFDIDPEMVREVKRKAERLGLHNLRAQVCDLDASGCSLEPESVDHVMVYNILHLEKPVNLLRGAFRVLKPGGLMSIMHWRRDIPTPRGPAPEIRPCPGDCAGYATGAGFAFVRNVDLGEAAPYHFGLIVQRPMPDPRP
jgi:SAM-dependent methyltransferase